MLLEEGLPEGTAGFPDGTAGFPDGTAGLPDGTADLVAAGTTGFFAVAP